MTKKERLKHIEDLYTSWKISEGEYKSLLLTNKIDMNKQGMIDAIYEKIANKELNHLRITELETMITLDEEFNFYTNELRHTLKILLAKEKEFKTINKPVMIWDVLDYELKEWEWDYEDTTEICEIWEHKRKPIEEQSEETIKYVYNLTK